MLLGSACQGLSPPRTEERRLCINLRAYLTLCASREKKKGGLVLSQELLLGSCHSCTNIELPPLYSDFYSHPPLPPSHREGIPGVLKWPPAGSDALISVTPLAISRHCSDSCVYVEVAGRAAGFEVDLKTLYCEAASSHTFKIKAFKLLGMVQEKIAVLLNLSRHPASLWTRSLVAWLRLSHLAGVESSCTPVLRPCETNRHTYTPPSSWSACLIPALLWD